MAVVFALPYLYDRVAERFARDGLDVQMTFGWLKSAEQLTSVKRIVWIPGDGDNVGSVGPAKYPGGDPRALATLNELCTVEITSADDSDPTDERKQYTATRELYDEWLRAVYLAGRGWYSIVSQRWAGGDRARRLGGTIRVVISVHAPIFDHASGADETIDPARARIDVAELEQTEILQVDKETP